MGLVQTFLLILVTALKLISLKVFLISLIPSMGFAEFDIDRTDQYQTTIIDKQSIPEQEIHSQFKASSPNKSAGSNGSEINSENEPKTSSIERLVQPLTRWAEDQLHDTSLVRTPNKKNPKPKNQTLNLRDAIRIAKKEHPGMVLGAEAISENGEDRFEIRIISQSGVIKTVSISSVNDSKDRVGINNDPDSNKMSDSERALQSREGGS